ncbi:spindle and kinetochore-associated protein 2-like isoform X2 [Salvelinus fontinalis]|uniref:spindle and kinetochore-associated protein 2-like isoform X2 n=1 Tax=Salvelinus fontinalis TaxID=8038 RepID=UPI002485DB38|nr:spindle and kinetochore-associated protein 2-like isoform X2 [Salvelinus fontinalis]
MNLTSGFIFTGLPGECKLFNMEIAVDKLEAMFQKAEADMEYMEKRLRLEFLTNAPENGATEENPVKLLENLSAIKVRHAALCTQVQEIAAEQKQSMDSIRAHLDTTVQLVQQLQQTAEVEWCPEFAEDEHEGYRRQAEDVAASLSLSWTRACLPANEWGTGTAETV